MPRKYVDYSKTYVYQLTYNIPENTTKPKILDSYISYTTNIIQRKYKHKREALDSIHHQSKLYDCIRKNGGWSNWKCVILEECSCSNENQAKERANFYIMKMKPNLNDEKMDEKSKDSVLGVLGFPGISGISENKPNIFADKVDASLDATVLDGAVSGAAAATPALASIGKEGKYVCLCKKTYAHRSSYYKHTSTCLQFQHCQTTNKPVVDNSLNTLSVSIISTTTTTMTTTMTTTLVAPVVATTTVDDNDVNDDDDENTEMVRYRFKSKKKANQIDSVFQYSNEPEPNSEISFQISEKPSYTYSDADDDDDGDGDESSVSASSASSVSESSASDNGIDDTDGAISVTTDATADSAVSELLSAQNEKLKEYIRKMISALTMDKKRSKKSLVNSLVFELLDQNKTLQKQIVELSKERNIIVNNTNNNQFNLNFFLNEQCKDAVNIADFVNSLEITMDDLTYTRDQGLVEGISKVMIDGLKQMDLYKRPIHCTDQKRDTIYIRDNHQWARDEGNARMRQVFVDIANKEYFAVKKWMDLHPGWETNSRLQDFHHKMIRNVLHEIKDDPIGERKIMKSIERETFIEK